MADQNERLKPPEGFQGPEKNRKCTDILFALLLILSWSAMTYIGYDAVQHGDLNVLTKGMQYDGSLCGVDAEVVDLPYLYYIRYDGTGVCVSECPSETSLLDFICLPEDVIPSEEYSSNEASMVMNGYGYCMYYYESKAILGHCVFSDTSVIEAFTSEYSDITELLKDFISDCKVARHTILAIGIFGSMALGFFYLMFVRFPCVMKILIWVSVLAILVLLVGLGYLMYDQANYWTELGTHSTTSIYALYTGAIVVCVLAFIWICVVCFLRSQIALAEDVVVEATRPVTAMPALFLWPILQALAVFAFLVPFFVFLIYTATLTNMVTEVNETTGFSHKMLEYSQAVKYRAIFLLFELYWTSQFIIALGQIILALAIAQWYFSRNKKEIGTGTFCTAIFQSFVFHLGTAAYGGLIMAIIKMIRAALLYVQEKTKKYHNKITEAILCCCQCCFWCLEKCVKFVNKNAYIQTAIFSTDFCKSCHESFHLILRNIGRVGAVTIVQEVILFIMQAFISIMAAFITYETMEHYYADNLYSLLNPTVMVFIVAWFISTQFRDIYGMAILTILHCFIADAEMFEPSQQFAEHSLRAWVDEFGSAKGEKQRLIVN